MKQCLNHGPFIIGEVMAVMSKVCKITGKRPRVAI